MTEAAAPMSGDDSQGLGPEPPRIRVKRSGATAVSADLASAARAYAERGLRLVPCVAHGEKAKSPHTRHGLHDASSDAEVVDRWWRAWPNALIGVAVPTRVVVLDIDPRNHGSLEAVVQALGPLPDTLTVISGRGDGGVHLYFRVPEVHLRGKIRGVPGVDVKTNGYMIAPPSPHPETGRAYHASESYRLDGLPALPEPAVEMLQRPYDSPKSSVAVTRSAESRAPRGSGWTPARAVALVRHVRGAPERERNSTLFFAACRVAEECPPHAVKRTMRLLAEAARDAGLPDSEMAATIASALSGTRRS